MFYALNRMNQYQRGRGNGGPPGAQAGLPPGQDALPAGQGDGRYQPAFNSPWRPGVDLAARQYGPEWVDGVARHARQVADAYREEGLDEVQVATRFAGPEGQPALTSPGGTALVNSLPPDVVGTLSAPQAREGVRAVVGDVVAPRLTHDADAIAQAIANVVASGDRQNPAQDVARALSARPEDLGGYYGAIGQFADLAQQHRLDADAVQWVVSGAAGGGQADPQVTEMLREAGLATQETSRLIRAAQLLPGKLEVKAGQLPPP
jgi:hypothetical protein